MEVYKIFVVLLLVSCSIGVRAVDRDAAKSGRAASANETTQSAANVTESSSAKPSTEPAKQNEVAAKDRGSLGPSKEEDKVAAPSPNEDEHKMTSGQILELARQRNENLERGQRLLDQKLVGRNILKEATRFDGIETTEDLIKYIVSLVVPDVLRALLSQKNEALELLKGSPASRSQHEPFVPVVARAAASDSDKESADAAKVEGRVELHHPFRAPPREPLTKELLNATLEDKRQDEPAELGNTKMTEQVALKKKKTSGKSASASSKRAKSQGQAIDAQSLHLAVQLLRSLSASGGPKSKNALDSATGPGQSSSNGYLKGREARRKQPSKMERRFSSSTNK